MEPDFTTAPAPGRKLAVVLGATAIILAAAGAFLFHRTESVLRTDPGRSSRTPEMLDKLLARADEAERAGDRGTAIVNYRFVLAVGAKGDSSLLPYITAAQRGLARLGATPAPSGPPGTP
ncbi:MAG TPA: hypothetical protein VN848_04070 [Gemmatimonadales bacterium]|nr:hypothetical protein [Gemmatimonadales bacterium]